MDTQTIESLADKSSLTPSTPIYPTEALAFGERTTTVAATKPAAKAAPSPKKVAASKPAAIAKKAPAATAQPTKKVANVTPPLKKAAKPAPWLRIIENLRDHPNNRPTTSTALERHLATFLGKGTPQAVVTTLIARLQREGVAVVNGKKIEYKIPDGKK